MKKNRIIFFGAMASMLLAANANAAQIASKEYVDALDGRVETKFGQYSTTIQVEGMISDAVTAGTVDITGKTDKIVPAADGNLAGLDATGNLTDSGVSAAEIGAMRTDIDNIDTDLTNLESSVTNIEGDVSSLQTIINTKADAADLSALATKDEVTAGLATKADDAATTAALAGKADAAAMATALLGKADLQGTGAADMVATVDANGQYIRSTTPMSEVATTTTVNNIVTDAIADAVADINTDINDMLTKTDAATIYETKDNVAAGLALKEDVANKSNNITTDSGSATKYTTVNAVQMYALPRPPADCASASSQCVLAVNTSGEPYWEAVIMPTPTP